MCYELKGWNVSEADYDYNLFTWIKAKVTVSYLFSQYL